ncbi:MAG: PIN domain-containing protein [Opitutaceae bacterium]|nr:PIN domain-containing protein [Opitutaceae bacterium]
MHLLDVSVLVALCDAAHEFHDAANGWFQRIQPAGWATCPLTENGLVRILGHPSYPGGTGSPAQARPLLQALLRTPGHAFWPDDVSICDSAAFPSLARSNSASLSDLYLLGLALSHGARFATFDRRIDPAVLPGGTAALVQVPLK